MVNHKDSKNIRLCSYHESGHIVLAYFVRWTVDSVRIEFDDDMVKRGVATYNYGNDKSYIDYIMNFDINEDVYQNYSDDQKRYCLTVAEKRIKALIGGPAAEKRIALGDNYVGVWEITQEFIRGPDFERAIQLSTFMKDKSTEYRENYLLSEIQTVSNFMTFKQFWTPLANLAEEIIASKEFFLTRQQIENSFAQSGYLEYIQNLYNR